MFNTGLKPLDMVKGLIIAFNLDGPQVDASWHVPNGNPLDKLFEDFLAQEGLFLVEVVKVASTNPTSLHYKVAHLQPS